MAGTVIFVDAEEQVRVHLKRQRPLESLLERPCALCGTHLFVADDALTTWRERVGEFRLGCVACRERYKQARGI